MNKNFNKGLRVTLLLTILLINLGLGNVQTVHAAAPSNDNWESAYPLTETDVPFTQTVNIDEATIQTYEDALNPTCDGKLLAYGNNSIWYKYTPGVTKYISFDTVGSTIGGTNELDTYIAVWTGNAINALTLKGCDDDNDLGYTSQFSFTAEAGTTYYIQIAKYKCTLPGCSSPDPACTIGDACSVKLNVKFQTFVDVAPIYWSFDFVERLYNAGITSGCSTNPLMYCPTRTVTRDQMAIFLLRGKNYPSSYNPPTATGVFQDVPTNYWAADWIEQLAVDGITSGCSVSPKLYCPTAAVTRDQMAIFLLRAKYGSSYVPPPATGVFQDVPTNYWAADWIEQLAAEGITSGCSVTPKLYCPTAAVTRDQMAVFLVRNFNLP